MIILEEQLRLIFLNFYYNTIKDELAYNALFIYL